MIPRVHWIVILVIFTLGLVVSAGLWHRLPEPSPVHWDLQGKVDGWGPRWQVAWLLPPVALAVVMLMAFLPWLGPFRRNMESFQVTYGRILVLVRGGMGADSPSLRSTLGAAWNTDGPVRCFRQRRAVLPGAAGRAGRD